MIPFLAWCVVPGPGVCAGPSVSRVPAFDGQWITALAAGADGIWVGTAGGQVTSLRAGGQAGRAFGPKDGLPPGKIQSVAVLDGTVYAGTELGFGVFDGTSWKIIPSAGGKSLKNVYLRAETTGKGLWVGAVDLSGGLLRLEGGAWRFLGGRGVGLLNNVQAFAFQGDTSWLGTVSSGVLSWKEGDIRKYRTQDGLPSETVYALEAFGGTVWAGTSAGVAGFGNGRWTAHPKSVSMPLSAVFCMAAGPEALYLGGREGLVRHRGGRFEPFPSGDPALRIGRVNALLYHEGALHVGTADGLLRVEGW